MRLPWAWRKKPTVSKIIHLKFSNGDQLWKRDGLLHREDGPAAIYPNGRWAWMRNGVLHRVDGPAECYSDGSLHWYINGQKLPSKKVEQWMRDHEVSWPFDKQTQVEFLLSWI